MTFGFVDRRSIRSPARTQRPEELAPRSIGKSRTHVRPVSSLRPRDDRTNRDDISGDLAQIAVDKTEGRVETSATVSEEVSKALKSKDPLARGGLSVVPRDIAGTRFEPATFGLWVPVGLRVPVESEKEAPTRRLRLRH